MYQIKAEDIYKEFSNNKEMFDFSNYLISNYLIKSKYCNDSNR